MTPDAEARARELFYAFDGSEFYMSRDGVDEEFAALNVPRDRRREWMEELTARHLAALDQPGNWKTLSFFSHHSDYSHVAEVLAARPLGVWWERVVFLEELLRYVRFGRWLLRASGRDLARAAEITLEFGRPLLETAPTYEKFGPPGADVPVPDPRGRVERLLRSARQSARWRL